MRLHSPWPALTALLLSLVSSGCLFRSHKVESNLSKAPLQTATQQQLVEKLNSEANALRTINAAVDISTSIGGAKHGQITEYSVISGYILAQKPSALRMIGLLPIVRNRAFDMVSDGKNFELWIPPKNKFIIGPDEVAKPSPNPLENLRPQIILQSLLFYPVPPGEIAVLEARLQTVVDEQSQKHLEQPNYVLDIIRQDSSSGQWYLSRKIYINRSNLLPYRLLLFSRTGEIATDAHYGNFKDFGGIRFPTQIVIHRPQEEYTVGLKITKLTLNQPLRPEQFVLVQPPGAQVERLDGGPSSALNSDAASPAHNE
jgi:outer membrane lipoprotein-sorting protein